MVCLLRSKLYCDQLLLRRSSSIFVSSGQCHMQRICIVHSALIVISSEYDRFPLNKCHFVYTAHARNVVSFDWFLLFRIVSHFIQLSFDLCIPMSSIYGLRTEQANNYLQRCVAWIWWTIVISDGYVQLKTKIQLQNLMSEWWRRSWQTPRILKRQYSHKILMISIRIIKIAANHINGQSMNNDDDRRKSGTERVTQTSEEARVLSVREGEWGKRERNAGRRTCHL